MSRKKVLVGMSGGVDSSAAAWILKEQGYDVIGAHMQLWQEQKNASSSEDAKRVAEEIGIPFYVLKFETEFKQKVVDYFVGEYICGRTPNPCIACNRFVKWEALLQRGRELGADYIATGHYARIQKRENGRYAVTASKTAVKDQTYALYRLTQEQLAHTIMPIGEYTKEEVRSIAAEIGLKTADKPDSQEICFIPDHDYAGFILRQAKEKVPEHGNFVTADGEILGRHKGIIHYTIGQRKGLNLAMGRPVFVTEIRRAENEVVIGEAEDVFTKEFVAGNINFMGIEKIEDGMRFRTKIRYAHGGAMATLYKEKDKNIRFVFDEKQRAITSGQSAVFYDGDCVAGGGVIL